MEVFRQIVSGVKALHDKEIIHGRLHPKNILYRQISGKIEIKVADFYLLPEFPALPVKWTSPEFQKNQPLSAASDIFHLGCIFYFIFSGGKFLFPEVDEKLHFSLPSFENFPSCYQAEVALGSQIVFRKSLFFPIKIQMKNPAISGIFFNFGPFWIFENLGIFVSHIKPQMRDCGIFYNFGLFFLFGPFLIFWSFRKSRALHPMGFFSTLLKKLGCDFFFIVWEFPQKATSAFRLISNIWSNRTRSTGFLSRACQTSRFSYQMKNTANFSNNSCKISNLGKSENCSFRD